MSKQIAIITDTHFGIKNDAQYMLDYQQKFYDEIFFPYLKDNDIKTVFHLGDLFDRRKYINFITLQRTKDMFLDRLDEAGIEMFIIPGNHDVYHKNTNDVNSLTGLLKEYEQVHVIEKCRTITDKGGTRFGFIPWINNENYEEILNDISEWQSVNIACGHLELAGYEMYAGVKNDHGMQDVIFEKFDEVWSGHFHHKSDKKNVRYLGAPMEFTFADCDDPRGFHSWDTEKKELTFHKNPFTLYEKIYYNDEQQDGQDYFRSVDTSQFAGKYIKLFVVRKTKPALFEHFIDRLFNEDVINLIIHEDYSEFHESNVDMEEIKEQSTKDLMDNYVETLETDMDKSKISSILNTLYVEALHAT